MRLSLVKRFLRGALAGVCLLGLTGLPAQAGDLIYQPQCIPGPVYPGQPLAPIPSVQPGQPAAPGQESTSAAQPEAPPAFAEARAPGGVGTTVAFNDPGAYLDSALIQNQFRLRYSSAYDDNRPDRAEYIYPKCGCFRTEPVSQGGDPHAPGPVNPETRIDFQNISAYTEVALGDRFSAFVEAQVIFLNPEQNENTAGFGDMNAGFKFAFLKDCDKVGTFQLRTYIPTGAASHGLGTDHVSIEPSLLYFQQLTDRLTLEAQLTDWIPVGGTDFAGNVLSYGAGIGYTIYQSGSLRITPVLEMFGWTVLDGKEFAYPEGVILDAAGDTIINLKGGVRFWLGENQSFYAGYGRALTGDVWYKDIIRAEYRLTF